MKTINLSQIEPFYHISGYHNPRELSQDERDEPKWIVGWQDGFDISTVAVYGHGLCESDAMEAAQEFFRPEREPDYCQET